MIAHIIASGFLVALGGWVLVFAGYVCGVRRDLDADLGRSVFLAALLIGFALILLGLWGVS